MKINLFAICKNDKFIQLMENLYNQENIYISGVCKDLTRTFIQFNNVLPKPDIVVMDAYWPKESIKDLLSRFLEMKVKNNYRHHFPGFKHAGLFFSHPT